MGNAEEGNKQRKNLKKKARKTGNVPGEKQTGRRTKHFYKQLAKKNHRKTFGGGRGKT